MFYFNVTTLVYSIFKITKTIIEQMIGDFGCVERVNFDGERVDLKFVKPDGRIVNRELCVLTYAR